VVSLDGVRETALGRGPEQDFGAREVLHEKLIRRPELTSNSKDTPLAQSPRTGVVGSV